MLREEVPEHLLEDTQRRRRGARELSVVAQTLVELGGRDVDPISEDILPPIYREWHDRNAELSRLEAGEVGRAVGDDRDSWHVCYSREIT